MTTTTYMLNDYRTGAPIRIATKREVNACIKGAKKDGIGVILVDGRRCVVEVLEDRAIIAD